MGDSTLPQKSILEGKVTFNPASFHIFSLSPREDRPPQSALPFDRTQWDWYLVSFPFTLHVAPTNSYYEELTFFVELANPDAIAVDLFPSNIITTGKERKAYTLSPSGHIVEVDSDLAHTNRVLQFMSLQPIITAFGEGENTFYWVYQGFGDRKEVIPETKHTLVVLRVPRGTACVDGTIHFQAIAVKKLLGGLMRRLVGTASSPIHLELIEAPPFYLQDASDREESRSLVETRTGPQSNGEKVVFGEASLQTFGIRITEEPLTAHNLATTISTLTELSTKCWLISQGRFAELMEYAQTHNSRFAQEARVIITKIAYNSPMNMDWKVELSASNVADALVTAIDGITHIKKRLEKAELENRAREQEVKQAAQKSDQERQTAQLEAEKQRLELEEQRLAILEKRLEVQKKEMEYALEVVVKMVDILYPNVTQEAKPMLLQALLPNLLQLQSVKGLELSSPVVLDPLPDQQASGNDFSGS